MPWSPDPGDEAGLLHELGQAPGQQGPHLVRGLGRQARHLGDELLARGRPVEGRQLLWVELPAPCGTLDLFTQAWDAGSSLAPGPMSSPSGGDRRLVRRSASRVRSEAAAAVRTLGALAGAQVAAGPAGPRTT